MSDPTAPTAPTQADVALLAAHRSAHADGRPYTYADALAYLTCAMPARRAALLAELWRRYGPEEDA